MGARGKWLGLFFLLVTGLADSAQAQTVPPAKPKAAPKTTRAAKIQGRKDRRRAILATPTRPTPPPAAPRRVVAPAKPGQRPGSAPTPPVRYVSPDPRDPMGPPPPGVRNTGQPRVPGTSHKPVPDTLAPGGTTRQPGLAPTDTTGLVNGVTRTGDSLQLAARRRGQIETTIEYTAKDSIQFDVTNKVARHEQISF